MREILYLLLLILIVSACKEQDNNLVDKKVDFSSVDRFWTIVDSLKKDKIISEEHWKELFNTPYYSFYEDWGQKQYIQKILTIAYMPSKNKVRDSILAGQNWNSILVFHLKNVDSLKNHLQEFRLELEGQNLLEKALEKTKTYLPEGTLKKYVDRPRIFFGIFQPDGNADSSIVIDLKLAMDIDIVGFIAHEAHHYYSNKIRQEIEEDRKDSTFLLLHSISQLQLEGLADLIDKEGFLKNKGKGFPENLYKIYYEHYSTPATVLHKVDSLLTSSANFPQNSYKNYQQIKDIIPLGGHPHGYYMARVILANEGKEALFKTIENPFEFVKIYNKAASKTKVDFLFSKEALAHLNEVEKKYYK